MSEHDFRRHIEWLATGSVKVLSLEALLDARDSDNAVALTFDDAFQNFRSVAAPLLEHHGFPAILFVATARAGSTNAWMAPRATGEIPILPLLDWEGVASVAERGISIGSHCRTHRPLTKLDIRAVREELAGSAGDVKRELGIAPTIVAYPYGYALARERAEAAGIYTLGVGTELKPLSGKDDRMLLPRIDAYYLRQRGRLESFGTARFARFLRIRSGGRMLRASVDRLLGQGGG